MDVEVHKELIERLRKVRHLIINRDPNTRTYIEETLLLADQHGEADRKGELLISLSNYYSLFNKDLDKCLECVRLAEPYFDMADSRRAGYYYGNLGINYHFFYKLHEAQDAYLTAIRYMEEIEDMTEEETNRLATIYYNLYILFSFTDLESLDRKYLDRAMELYKIYDHKPGIIFCYGAMVNDLDKEGKTEEALYYARLRLQLAEEINDATQIGIACSSLGLLHARLGERGTAMTYIERAREIAFRNDIIQFHASFYDEKAQAFLALDEYEEAIESFEKAIRLYDVIDPTLNLSKLYRHLSEAHEKAGNYHKALNYQRKYSRMLLDNFKIDKVLYMGAARNEFEQQQHERETNMLKQKNAEIRLYANQLEESNEELKQFAHAASHDLREPVRLIVSYAELLEMSLKGQLTAEQKEFFAYLKEGGKRIHEMIAGILTFSKIHNHTEQVDINLNTVMEVVKNNLKLAISARNAVIESENLPTIPGNQVLMTQLFQNIIANAIKYNHSDQPLVRISYRREGNNMKFSISDNGMGIDEKYRETVFDIFTRLHNREQYSGSGIGLAICKKIIDRLGGTIWNEPSAGGGTSFIFTIPLS